MNTKDEIFDVIDGKHEGAAPPVIFTQSATLGQMERCGEFFPDAIYQKDKMIRLALQPSEMFGFATARVPFDITEEAEALGCTVQSGSSITQPFVVGSPWRSAKIPDYPDDLPSVDEFLAHDRIRTVIEASECIHTTHDLFVTSLCTGSSFVASLVLGMENMTMGLITDLDGVMSWVKNITSYLCAYAKELSSVSDNVMMIAGLSEDLYPPDVAAQFAKIEDKVLQSIKGACSMLHCCGRTLENVDIITSLKPDILSLETSKIPESYLAKVNGRALMLGCISPVRELLTGNAQDVLYSAKRSNELGFDFVGPECGVSPLTPDANLQALATYRDHL